MQGYRMKCREKREFGDARQVALKNGRAAWQGACTTCGTKVTVMGTGEAKGLAPTPMPPGDAAIPRRELPVLAV